VVESAAPATLYEEIAQRMRQHIAAGRYASGKLPSHRQLCRLYQVSLPTIKSAIGVLEREDLVVSRPRSGVYLTDSAQRRALSAGMVRCINMFLPSHFEAEHAYWHVRESYLMGANHAAHDAGVQLRLSYMQHGKPAIDYMLGGEPATGEVLSPNYRPWEQACFFVACNCPDIFQSLYERGVPFVIETHVRQRRPYQFPNHCRTWVDKADGAAQAVDYLAKIGHTRIGYVGRGYCVNPNSWLHEQAPCDGFLAGMRRNRLEIVPEYVKQLIGWARPTQVEPEVRELMSLPDLPTAIVTGGDMTAIHCIELARERGLRVPQDLSVVGMNDQPEAAMCDPPLTTMRTPHYEATRAVIRALTAPGREPWREPLELVHKCELVVRGTTAPPGRQEDREQQEEGGRVWRKRA